MTVEKRRRVMQSLSALAKFTGCYERYSQLIKSYGLKWTVNNDDIIIARLIKYSGANGNACTNDLFSWVRLVKQQIPDFSEFMDFTISTGLRLSESIESYRLIVELSEKGKLDEYYNCERNVLEHFRFKQHFIRRTKKAFMSFVPNELINRVGTSGLIPTKDMIERRIRRRKLKLCFSDLRELWASRAVRHLSQPEIDFLQGRVSASVFMQNYFNPLWISDLKIRAIKNANILMKATK
jgi:intergrase/recombinase